MPWKPWVEIEKRSSKNEDVQKLFDEVMDPETKVIPDLCKLTSTTPIISAHINRLRDSIAENKSGLSFKEKEIAATIVAVLNGCVH
ncbi:MAG: hypothetical protein DWP97_07845 [Calditrichaeota bacterium]|nr:MAG: hypothetical protein DWP97_07845 [Calditrichota bacterium]